MFARSWVLVVPSQLEQLKRACCHVTCGPMRGTGYLVTPGWVATCAHVVREAGAGGEIQVRFGDRVLAAIAIACDEQADCALLELAEPVVDRVPLPLARGGRLRDPWTSYGFAQRVVDAGMEGLILSGKVRDPKGAEGSGVPVLVLYCDEVAAGRGALVQGCSGSPVLVSGAVIGHLKRISPDDANDQSPRAEYGQLFACPAERLAALRPGTISLLSAPDSGISSVSEAAAAAGHGAAAAQVLAARVAGAAGTYSARMAGVFSEYMGTDAGRHVPFGGRQNELRALSSWLDDLQRPARLLLTAPAGRGKTALLMRWSAQLLQQEGLHVLMFPVSARFSTNLASVVFAALGSALASLHDEAPPSITCSADMMRALLTGYLQRPLPTGQRLLLILDGIDEAADWHIGPDLVPQTLPPGLKVLLAARERAADATHTDWLQELGWTLPPDAECLTLPPLRLSHVAEIVGSTCQSRGVAPPPPDYCANLHRLSEGDPLVLQLYLQDLITAWQINGLHHWIDLPANIPGLAGYFAAWWKAQRLLWGGRQPLKERAVQAVLNLLACALGPLAKDDLMQLAPAEANLGSLSLGQVLDDLSRFVIGDGRQRGYVFSHPRLAAWFYDGMSEHERWRWEKLFLSHSGQLLAAVQQGRLLPEKVSSYFIDHYGAHLERAKVAVDAYQQLLSSAWYKTWQTRDPTLAGFVYDVNRAWQAASAPAGDSEKSIRWGDELRCALILAGVASVSRDVTPAVLGALVEKRVWSPTQALLFAQRWPPNYGVLAGIAPQLSTAGVVHAVAPQLSDEQVFEVLSWAGSCASSYEAIGILRALVPYLKGSLFDVAVSRARAIRVEHDRAEALRMLLARAPAVLRSSLATATLEATRAIPDDAERARALTELIPELPTEQLAIARDLIAGLTRRHWYPSAPLARLALRLAEPERSELQRKALLPLLAAMKDGSLALDWHIPRRFAEIAPYLPAQLLVEARLEIEAADNETLRDEMLAVLLDLVRTDPDEHNDNMAPADLDEVPSQREPPIQRLGHHIKNAQRLSKTQRQELWQRTRDIADFGDRALCMARLLPHLPNPELGLQELLAELPSICRHSDPYQRPLILNELAAHLPADALSQILAGLHFMDDAPQRLEAVAALLPYVSPAQRAELAVLALSAALRIRDEEVRIRATLTLVPYLPVQQQQDTARWLLPAIQSLQPLRKARGYYGDGLHASFWQHEQDLDELCGDDILTVQGELLCLLVPYLPEALRIPLLNDLLPLPTPQPRRAVSPTWDALPELTRWSKQQDSLVKRIAALAPYIPTELHTETLATIAALPYQPLRATALLAISPFLESSEAEIQEAVAIARADSSDPFHLATNLAEIVKLLPDCPLRSQTASEIANCLVLVPPPSWADILAPIAEHLPTVDKTMLWTLIENFDFPQERAESMASLAPHMSDQEKQRSIQEAIDGLLALPDNHEDPGEVPPDFEAGYLRECTRLFRSSRKGLSALAFYLSDETLCKQVLQGLTFEPELVLPNLAQAAAMRSQQTGYAIWHQALLALADGPRDAMLTAVRHLAPLIAAHGGADEAARCARVILDLHDTTPAC